MTRRFLTLATIPIFVIALGVIILLILSPERFFNSQRGTQTQMRIVTPQAMSPSDEAPGAVDAERMAFEDAVTSKVALREGEIIVSILTEDIDGDMHEEQVIAYRNLIDGDGFIYITCLEYDPAGGRYFRAWDEPTLVTRPGTINISSSDLIGDRGLCVIITGLNNPGRRVMTILKRIDSSAGNSGSYSAGSSVNSRFFRIAEIEIDGAIVIQESERTQAYYRGLTDGESFPIVAYERDAHSANILDQLEITYAYNREAGQYERVKTARLPGAQVEQRRVRELLTGGAGAFEEFVSGLWRYVSPGGGGDTRQYVYFDPQNREIIFYGDDAQQIFTWLNSSATRQGIYIASQNISVTTLRRFLDIELESLEGIRINVFEDVRLKIGVSNAWDGSYRKAGANPGQISSYQEKTVNPHIAGVYDGAGGAFIFHSDGRYELQRETDPIQGRYAFFALREEELLELRPGSGLPRETYAVERRSRENPEDPEKPFEDLILSRVTLSVQGAQKTLESPIVLGMIRND